MTSEGLPTPCRLYVWAWLPGADTPVVAGVLTPAGGRFQRQEVLTFTYARSYRERANAMSLFPPELPLRPGTFDPTAPAEDRHTGVLRPRTPLPVHGCIRDSAPDAWGRRVINLRLASDPDVDLSELTYLASSGSNRIGALDFQESATDYVARGDGASLDQLVQAAELIEQGRELPEDLIAAAEHGTSIGGARPKALLDDGDKRLIAKFSSTADTRPVVKAEAAAMLLARQVGIDVALVTVTRALGKDVLLVERFDRPADGSRRHMVSALTVLGLAEMESRHSSYADLAAAVRSGPWKRPAATLRELYTRLVFNVCIGNSDDHLRNHAAFWDGFYLQLTPAFDLSPQPRSTAVSSQAIGITRDGRRSSQLWLCRKVAGDFHVNASDADAIIDHVVTTVRAHFDDACDEALLTRAERAILWHREFLNPYIFYDEA
jgi:serine/threonine-protein kinase HipA